MVSVSLNGCTNADRCPSTFSPTDPRQKYRYIQKLSEGLCVPAALLTYSAGGSVGNIVAIDRLPDKGVRMLTCH